MKTTGRTPESRANIAWAWFGAGLWGLLVWGLGTESLSMKETSRILAPLIHWLFPSLSQAHNQLLQFSIRKTAHLCEYAVLAVLVLRALWLGGHKTLGRTACSKAVFTALSLATAFAAADERRQSFSINRTGSLEDVILDGMGAAAGIGLLLLGGQLGLPWVSRWIVPQKTRSAEDTRTGTPE